MTLIPKNVTGNPATHGNASRSSEDDDQPVLQPPQMNHEWTVIRNALGELHSGTILDGEVIEPAGAPFIQMMRHVCCSGRVPEAMFSAKVGTES
jgi:hypothetical protein